MCKMGIIILSMSPGIVTMQLESQRLLGGGGGFLAICGILFFLLVSILDTNMNGRVLRI